MKFTHNRYKSAAAKYRPRNTRVLFVAEAPPLCIDRYFYFDIVKRHDSLWIELMKELFPGEKWRQPELERSQKRDWLLRFRGKGYYLIDALKKPTNCTSRARVKNIKARSRKLISEVKRINPGCIVLIKVTVYDALFREFKSAGLPVMDNRLPFPGSGRQNEFHRKFPRKCLR